MLVIHQQRTTGNSPADEATTDGHLLPFIHHTSRLAGHYSILIIAPGFFVSITGFKPMQKIGWVTEHRVEKKALRNYQFFKQRTEPSEWVLNWGIREYRYIIIWTQTVGHHHASAIQHFIFNWVNWIIFGLFYGLIGFKIRLKIAGEDSVLFQWHGYILRHKTQKKHTGRQTQNKTAK